MIFRVSIACIALGALAGASPPRATGEVHVAITDLRSTEGVVRACMTSDPERFPRCRGDDAAYRVVVPAADAGSLDFGAVRPGTYAIALLHDENSNGEADRALGLMPREGFGFSRDARVRMGPPDFEDASFSVRRAPVQHTIRMRYML